MLTWHHLVMLWHLEVLDPPFDPPKRLDTHRRASLDVYWHRVRLGLVSNRPEMTENDPPTWPAAGQARPQEACVGHVGGSFSTISGRFGTKPRRTRCQYTFKEAL